MLSLIVGGLYTLVVLALGCAAGYFVGSKQIDEVAESVRQRYEKPSVESGSLKPYTKTELADMKDPAVNKMAQILEGFHRDK